MLVIVPVSKERLFLAAADAVLMFHFLFAGIAAFGGFAVIFYLEFAWIQVPTVLWSAAITLMGWTCPLTPVEKRFRTAGGGVAYKGGFIQHYIGNAVYPRGMPRKLEITAGVSVLSGNAIIYAGIWLLS